MARWRRATLPDRPAGCQAALDQVKAQAQHDAGSRMATRAYRRAAIQCLRRIDWWHKTRSTQPTSNLLQSQATLAADAAARDPDRPVEAGLHRDPRHLRRPARQEPGARGILDRREPARRSIRSSNSIRSTQPQPERDGTRSHRTGSAEGADSGETCQTSEGAQPKFSGTFSFLDNAVNRRTGPVATRATSQPGSYAAAWRVLSGA